MKSKNLSRFEIVHKQKNITVISITNTPKDREEIVRAFIKSVYHIQTTKD